MLYSAFSHTAGAPRQVLWHLVVCPHLPVCCGSCQSVLCQMGFWCLSSSSVCFCGGTKGYSKLYRHLCLLPGISSPYFWIICYVLLTLHTLHSSFSEYHWCLSHSPNLGGKINCFLPTPFGRHCTNTVQARVIFLGTPQTSPTDTLSWG